MTLALDIPLNDTQFSAQRNSEVLVCLFETSDAAEQGVGG